MNPRERTLLFALIAVLVLGVGVLGTYYWFVVPLKNYNLKIAAMKDENLKQKMMVEDFNSGKKKLAIARLKSLPATPNEASSEYVSYLHSVLGESGLKVEEVTPAQNAVDLKPVTNIPGIKTVGHKVLSFQVKSRGTMAQVVDALEDMRRTPYEHRIKSLNIDRAENSPKDENAKLIIVMIIETLLVAKTDNKAGMPPGVDVKFMFMDGLMGHMNAPVGLGQTVATLVLRQSTPVETDRKYAQIASRNMFVGKLPKLPDITETKWIKEPYVAPPPQPPGPIPRFIRLTSIEPARQEAQYLNLFYRKDERKISAKENSGYNTFLIASDDLNYVFFLGKVLRVDNRDVFYQVKDKVFRWHVGDTLDSSYGEGANFLSIVVLDEFDLEPDMVWGKKELEKEKEKAKGGIPKKNVKGGKGK